ncbi:RNA 2',3'-cyclic phosphodiesterase [Elizabethkingia anophelis]|nr:RNA 2',3'-cyclic phosphodiesterase [Elizabethkingia anophelis]MDV3476657.1 RNA 2',3'-cyclic phosphodiesterase [Elizabethkingia anophelis]
MNKLYFIAIYPPKSIIEEIKVFKEDMARNYSNSKALKNDAHITLFPPFSRDKAMEEDIITAFQKIDTHISPFELVLDGFGSFPNPKNPVLFVQPKKSESLNKLHSKVKEHFNFIKNSFNPHVTVGYRDLSFDNFQKAWSLYEHKNYKTKFIVDEIQLLRYDRKWDPISTKKLTGE